MSAQHDHAPVRPAGQDRPIIAARKTCRADGTGLSHYILMDKPIASQDAGKQEMGNG